MSEFAKTNNNPELSVKDFARLSSNDWYLTPDGDDKAKRLRKEAKKAFMTNHDVRYPDVTYPRLDHLDMAAVEAHYQRLLGDSEILEDQHSADQQYEHAARKLGELFRHKEVTRRLGWSQDPDLSRKRAGAMTFELFGDIDINDYAHIIQELRTDALSLSDKSIEARELLELIGDVHPETDKPDYEIAQNTIEVLRADIFELFPGLEDTLSSVPDDDASIEEKAAFMQRVIDSVSSDRTARVNVIEGKDVAASTSVEDRQISIGATRLEKYSRLQLIKTSIHEAIGHLERGNRAAQQDSVALRGARSNNLAFEEGFATAIEQIITGETRVAGKQYYTAIGLQLGYDQNGNQRDFRQTYEIMWRRLFVQALQSGKPISHDLAQSQAYDQVTRTNRGGAVDARDISYFEGSKRYAWVNQLAMLEPNARKRALRITLSGRFDASNPEEWNHFENAYKLKEAA